jgi:D-alanyl-D-alanine carboxypeptidase/D-alanyl-D-alanine-endopeptidase (penicillin-binding protein 4)
LEIEVPRKTIDGLVVGLTGRHDVYIASLGALLADHGAEVEPLRRGPSLPDERIQVVLAESPLPSELDRLVRLGAPVVVLSESPTDRDVRHALDCGAVAVLAKNCTLGELSVALGAAIERGRLALPATLTVRQRQVLRLLAEGLDNSEIAARLGISQRTARAHVSSLLERLGVANRTQAAVAAVRSGWLGAILLLMLVVLGGLAASPAAGSTLSRALTAHVRAAGGTSGAWVVDSTTGEDLFAYNAEWPRTPASVEKLFTTATALERLGEDTKLETEILSAGTVDEEGVLDGNIYIKGAGDPSFTSRRLSALSLAVRQAGVREILGGVYGDESLFDRRRGTGASGFRVSRYIGPLSALSFNGGYAFGGFQSNPAQFVAGRLRASLATRGIEVGGPSAAARAPTRATTLVRSESSELARLVRYTNQLSSNYFAETLLKVLGARFGGAGSTVAGAAVVRRFAAGVGARVRAVDGSGLSRNNLVTPRSVGRLLLGARNASWFESFYRSLPLAGHTGTLRKRMRKTAAKGRCRAKTGTLAAVSALAGYCHSRGGQLIAFSILMNGVNVPAARAAQDRFAATLAALPAPP